MVRRAESDVDKTGTKSADRSEAWRGVPTPGMPERPHSRKHHRQPWTVGGRDHFLVPHRAARLNHRCDPASVRPAEVGPSSPDLPESTPLILPAPTVTLPHPRARDCIRLTDTLPESISRCGASAEHKRRRGTIWRDGSVRRPLHSDNQPIHSRASTSSRSSLQTPQVCCGPLTIRV